MISLQESSGYGAVIETEGIGTLSDFFDARMESIASHNLEQEQALTKETHAILQQMVLDADNGFSVYARVSIPPLLDLDHESLKTWWARFIIWFCDVLTPREQGVLVKTQIVWS